MLILGIDPGTALMGYGLVAYERGRLQVIDYGCWETSPAKPISLRLQILYRSLQEVFNRYRPDHVAVEELFFNKNVRTAISIGEARGVALLAAAEAGLPVFEYTPLQVKQAVVGYGRAEKVQVQAMVKALLGLKEVPKPDDAADALAVAICHAHSYRGEADFNHSWE